MTVFKEYETFDGLGLANLVKTGVVSPTELLEAAIDRIEAVNPELNAVIYKMYDEAHRTAKNPHLSGQFQGVPFLLKDLMADYAGVPLQFGSRFMKGYVSNHDSEIVKRIKKAGLVVLGKTNTPEFGLSPVTEPLLFGPTRNPWDLTRTPGGSSGGSAVAVASSMVPMAQGGDGGGSLRTPAAYCGVLGLKPSRGRTPTGPDVMQAWQGMIVQHVITRSVRDCAAMLDELAGPELGSLIALPKPETRFLDALTDPCRKLNIAVCSQPFFSSDIICSDYKNALMQAAKLCQDLGHHVDIAAPKIASSDVTLAYVIVVAAETAASIKLLAKTMQRKADYAVFETATAVLCEVGEHFSAKDFVWASHVLDIAGRDLAEFFLRYDVLMTPTMPLPPPLIGGLGLDRIEKSVLEILRHVPCGPLLRKLTRRIAAKNFAFTPFTPLSNMTGQPAISVPLYWDKNGLPIGIHFAARVGDDRTLLQLAGQLEEALPWEKKRPVIN